MKQNLKKWLFSKDGKAFYEIKVPHDAMLTENRSAESRGGVQSGFFPGGKYIYTTTIDIEKGWLGGKIELHFEGVYRSASVFVNGTKAASHAYGYSEFRVDISELVKAGENTVTVEADNTLVPNCRWYSGAGLYRTVWLLVNELPEPRIVTRSYFPAVIEISGCGYAEIWDGETMITSGGEGEYEIPNAKLWSADTPYLYTLRASGHEIRFGIRKIEWKAEAGLMINGQPTLLRGGCIHHDNGVLGAGAYNGAEYRRVKILKEQGFNALRISHNPASRALLNACDELGMYVMDECFDGWYIPKDYHDYSRQFMDNYTADLEAMVRKDLNHPSVILYSIGNEVTETAEKRGIELAAKMRDLLHALDMSRPVTCGVNVLLNVYTKLGMGVYKDKGVYKAEPLPMGKKYKEKKTGSAFFNAMAGRLGRLMFFMSKGALAEKLTADFAPSVDMVGLNYASSRYDPDVRKYPDRMMIGTETMARDLPYNWERVKKYPQLIGDFVWAAWDYLGEACIGDWTYHSYKGLPLLAGQGMIDITGKPLASMAFMQTVWGRRKEPFIAVSPLNHSGETPSTGAWQFTNGIDSWNWQGFEGKKTTAWVFADADKVRLELNGIVIGEKRTRDNRAKWTIRYRPGELTAVALDPKGRELSRFSLNTGDGDPMLSVKANRFDDLTFLEIEFTDRSGALLPYIEKAVTVHTNGPDLLGFGSALCKTDERYDSDTFTAYRGRLLAVVRGPGSVTVSADGVVPVVIELTERIKEEEG